MNDVDEDLKLLMCGKNLSRLGLNLQQEKSIASYFSGVFTDSELDDSEQPEYSLPVCYYLSKPILKLSHIKKFSDNTLFYIFYNMPGEKL